MRRSRQPWSFMSLVRRFVEHRLEAIGCTGSLSNAPNLIRLQKVICVSASVKLSAIRLHHMFQKSGNACTLLSATGSDSIVIIAVTNEVKAHVVKRPFLRCIHSFKGQPDQRWHVIQEPFHCGQC
jgi:hypothetical protein